MPARTRGAYSRRLTRARGARQDMRMKFEADDPAEVTENKQQDNVDRSQGAARAISVSVRARI